MGDIRHCVCVCSCVMLMCLPEMVRGQPQQLLPHTANLVCLRRQVLSQAWSMQAGVAFRLGAPGICLPLLPQPRDDKLIWTASQIWKGPYANLCVVPAQVSDWLFFSYWLWALNSDSCKASTLLTALAPKLQISWI